MTEAEIKTKHQNDIADDLEKAAECISDYVVREVMLATSRGIRIYPVELGGDDASRDG